MNWDCIHRSVKRMIMLLKAFWSKNGQKIIKKGMKQKKIFLSWAHELKLVRKLNFTANFLKPISTNTAFVCFRIIYATFLGILAYLATLDKSRVKELSFVVDKSRIATTWQLSIRKLELQAAFY